MAVGAQPAAPCLVVWQHDNGSDDDIHGRRVGSEGNLLGSEITVASGAVEQRYPAVAANGAGGYVVAWQEGSSNSDVAAAVVDWDGSVLGAGAELLSAAGNSQERPALSYDADRGRYLAVWADYRNAAEGPDVYGQLYRDYTVVIDYRYDPLQRLVGADYSTGVHFGYAYDEAGNRTRLTETTPLSGTVVTTYTLDAANRLTGRQVSDGRSYSYEWSDRNELLAEETQGVDVRTFEWDAAGRLVEATVFTLTTHFTYAGDGTRAALEVAGHGTTAYVSDQGGQILVERTAATTTRYLYGRGCLGEVRDGALLYYLSDGPGYVRQAADAAGTVVDAWLYTPAGGVMAGPQGPVSHLVCGGIYDWSTGLLYRGGRYFDPTLSIWLALGVGMVVQGWREKRRKQRGFVWILLMLLVVLGAGGLVACGPTPQPPPLCVDVRGNFALIPPNPTTGFNPGTNSVELGQIAYVATLNVGLNCSHVPGTVGFAQLTSGTRRILLDDNSLYVESTNQWYVDDPLPPDLPKQFWISPQRISEITGRRYRLRAGDNPGVDLDLQAHDMRDLPRNPGAQAIVRASIDERFETYVVYDPELSVPGYLRPYLLGKIAWQWSVEVQYVQNQWVETRPANVQVGNLEVMPDRDNFDVAVKSGRWNTDLTYVPAGQGW